MKSSRSSRRTLGAAASSSSRFRARSLSDERVGALAGRRVLVTGGRGFIGSHLVRRLLAEGADVHIVSRTGLPTDRFTETQRLTWHIAPSFALDTLRAIVCTARPSLVYHLAADTSTRHMDAQWHALDRALDVNIMGTIRLIDALRDVEGVEHVIRLGGLEEYGRGPIPFLETQREAPVSPYSASQVAVTHFFSMLQAHVPFALTTLRPALVYGPGQPDTFLIPTLIRAGLAGTPMRVQAGNRGRDLIFIDDLIDAMYRTATIAFARGAVINIGSGRQWRMREIAERIHALTGARSALQIDETPSDVSVIDDLVCDVTQAATMLRWRATTGLEVGLPRTVAACSDATHSA